MADLGIDGASQAPQDERVRMIVLVVLLSGCGASALTIANGTALGVSTATLACDWAQTRKAAATGWKYFYESNPIMGRRPTVATVDIYFWVALVANTTLWFAMPRKYRAILPIIIAAREVYTIADNNDVRFIDLDGCGVASNMM